MAWIHRALVSAWPIPKNSSRGIVFFERAVRSCPAASISRTARVLTPHLSIVVLPFANFGQLDSDVQFADVITESQLTFAQ